MSDASVPSKTIHERLMEACNGHPYAKIPWPHRLLHDAAAEIERLQGENQELHNCLDGGYDCAGERQRLRAALERIRSRAKGSIWSIANGVLLSLQDRAADGPAAQPDEIAEPQWRHSLAAYAAGCQCEDCQKRRAAEETSAP